MGLHQNGGVAIAGQRAVAVQLGDELGKGSGLQGAADLRRLSFLAQDQDQASGYQRALARLQVVLLSVAQAMASVRLYGSECAPAPSITVLNSVLAKVSRLAVER